MSGRLQFPDTAYQNTRKKRVATEELQKDAAYLKWLHLAPCIVTGQSGVVAHHLKVERAPGGGLHSHQKMGLKSTDYTCVPLLPELHDGYPQSLHAHNEAQWWAAHGIDPVTAAAVYSGIYRSGFRSELTEQQHQAIRRLARP